MRNIDASEWLTDPSLDILETKDAAGGTGSEFTLNATQKNPQVPANDDEQPRVAQGAAK
jgi:Tfp pilus assembly protein PilN